MIFFGLTPGSQHFIMNPMKNDVNVVFIVVDTLRASRLGCYGYHRPTSPAIDRLASNGALFEKCFAQGIPTTPAHTTMFTGLHPITHNIVCHGGKADLDRKVPVLPELLQLSGLTTCAVDNLYDIKPWLARGYEFYINPSFRHKLRLLVSCEEINARAVPWIESHSSEQFFLFLHYWEPHTPYLPPERYRTFYPSDRNPFGSEHTSFEPIKRQPFWDMFKDLWFNKLGPVTDAEYVASLYDAEIRHVDDGINEIVQTIERCGLSENTLIVLTGDHGESMYQHDIFFDHHGLYDDTIHVPLIMSMPGTIKAGTVRTGMVQHMDIAPTLLDAVSAQGAEVQRARAVFEGSSMWDSLTRDAESPASSRIISCENTWQSKWSLRTNEYKLIVARRPDKHGMPDRELYDLNSDPGETVNLVGAMPHLRDEMTAELEKWIASELEKSGRSPTEDPLIVQPITLGNRWNR